MSKLTRRKAVAVLGAVAASAAGSLWLRRGPSSKKRAISVGNELKETRGGERIVSLSPGLTETIEALDSASSLVAVSDYCLVQGNLPRVGTAIVPRFEDIARLRPTLIATTAVAGTQLQPLQQLAPTLSLPWLSVSDFSSSVQRLGKALHQTTKAQQLAERLQRELSARPAAHAPRVLWVLDLGDSDSTITWYIRDSSIHGAVLRAAGARNAAATAAPSQAQSVGATPALAELGQPRLSPEELLRVDPDLIIAVVTPAEKSAALARLRGHFARFEVLRASAQPVVIAHDRAMSVGPSVLSLIDSVRAALKQRFPDIQQATPQ